MADNGNRGPNDAFRRGGRRRREPPIIDAAASEVPPETVPTETPEEMSPVEPEAGERLETPVSVEAGPNGDAEPGRGPTPVASSETQEGERAAEPAIAAEQDEPVLFGSAMRDPSRRATTATEPAPETPEPERAADPVGSETAGAFDVPPSSERGETRLGGAAAPSAQPPSAAGNPLASILGIAAVILLAVIGWLLYAGGPRGGDAAALADLKTRIATLESRPDPAALQAQLATLEKRVAAAEGDRANLGKAVAALEKRVDGLGQGAGTAAQPAQGGDASAPAKAGGNPGQPAPADVASAAALTALSAKVDGLEGRIASLASDEAGTAKAIADLPKPVAPDFGPVNARIAALESAVNAADAKINGSDARFNAFDAKVNGIDGKVNDSGARLNGITDRINGLEAKIDDVSAAAGKLKTQIADLPKVDLAPLQASTAALDARVAKVESALAAPKDGARVTEARAVGSDETKATPIAVVAQTVEQAVASGRPYPDEIDALKALGADPALVARLAPDAKDGAPSVEALAAQWKDLRGAVLATVAPVAPRAGGTLNRLFSSATSIVHVHKTGAVEGEDTTALVSQIDAALADGDVPAALAAWDKLPDDAKAASQAWAEAARNRTAAAAAAGDLVRNAIATLGHSPS